MLYWLASRRKSDGFNGAINWSLISRPTPPMMKVAIHLHHLHPRSNSNKRNHWRRTHRRVRHIFSPSNKSIWSANDCWKNGKNSSVKNTIASYRSNCRVSDSKWTDHSENRFVSHHRSRTTWKLRSIHSRSIDPSLFSITILLQVVKRTTSSNRVRPFRCFLIDFFLLNPIYIPNHFCLFHFLFRGASEWDRLFFAPLSIDDVHVLWSSNRFFSFTDISLHLDWSNYSMSFLHSFPNRTASIPFR